MHKMVKVFHRKINEILKMCRKENARIYIVIIKYNTEQ